MSIISELFGKVKRDRSAVYQEASSSIERWNQYMADILSADGQIPRSDFKDGLARLYEDAARFDKLSRRLNLFPGDAFRTFKESYSVFKTTADSFESSIESHNAEYLKTQIDACRSLIGDIEGHALDDQQIMCIIKDAHDHNVVAGAGTGKTTTIIGKVKYLLKTGKYTPDEILVLSFTRAAAMEMKERLRRNTNAAVDVSTFHSLGYHIMAEVEGKKPLIFTDSPADVMREKLDELVKDPSYSKRLFLMVFNGLGTVESDIDQRFESLEDYRQYTKEHPPETIKGEIVKSYGEMKVANILASNKVSYVYEHSYEHDTATKEHAQYTPDFYLPDYGIYIEYFGIDRDGNVPDWFEGDDPGRTYRESMEWKRQTHRKYSTTMIECYAYEDSEHILEEELERKLTEAGVVLEKATLDEYLSMGRQDKNKLLSEFISTAVTITNLARSKKIGAGELAGLAGDNWIARRLAELVAPLQRAYERHLEECGKIDFADMLNRAENMILSGSFANHYRCVIVDEYQDLTSGQYRLLKALRKSLDFELFCVGDDWQSIYRFNGSDISYIMDFERFWGDGDISRIETTYRFSQSLIDVSSSFIMENPKQIRKAIKAKGDEEGFSLSKIEGYRIEEAVRFMTDRLMFLPKGKSVFFIGRYSFDIDLLKTEPRLTVRYDTATQTQKILLQGRPDLNITFYTAHRSKGLQADYVYIINNGNGRYGFPSSVEDDPLTQKLLESADIYPFSEERRLFYVALTRARKHVYLLTVKDSNSVFVNELEAEYGSDIVNETYVCPRCGGQLRVIEGRNGKFFGCSNYRTKNCRYTVSL
ncbi:MAG: UvrD-helicase domain-containing protein [Firmicutes bacterium]|nr:UvrD-helicase domain-containing protein [Bacillota bacterium]